MRRKGCKIGTYCALALLRQGVGSGWQSWWPSFCTCMAPPKERERERVREREGEQDKSVEGWGRMTQGASCRCGRGGWWVVCYQRLCAPSATFV